MKVVGIGNAIIDVICKVDENFITKNNLIKGTMKLIFDENEFKKLLSNLKVEKTISGGSVANSIAGLSKFDNEVGFIGKISDDDFGKKYEKGLKDENVNFFYTKKKENLPTGTCLILVTPDSERTMCTYLGIAGKINKNDVPSNFTTFYENHTNNKLKKERKIKFNNKKIHQSKLLNYFLNKTSLPKAEKETNDILKKIKRNKKYVFSTKDMILIESLKSDGVKIDKKYSNLYEYNFKFSSDIKQMLSNGELGLLLIKIVDIVGESNLEDLDINTVNLLVSTMNELKNVDLRNEILIEVLPLKV